MKIYGLLFFIFFFQGKALSQLRFPSDSTILYISSQIHYGFIIPHRRAIEPLVNGTRPWGISVEASRLRYTQSAWKSCNCYSQNGIALTYFNFDQPVLGSSINLIAFAEPYLTLKNINIMLRAGLGLSYLTKVYHWESNPDNVLFSSPLSGLLLLQLTTRAWLSKNFGVRLSGAYYHISNGGMRQPNLGMNFTTVSIGAEYSIGRMGLTAREKYFALKNAMTYYAGLFFTTGKVSPMDDLRKPILGLSGGFYKPFAPMHGIGMGIEVVKDWALKERSKQSEDIDHYIISALLRHHFIFGKFDFSQALGFYLYKRYPTPNIIFQRYALTYRLTKRLEFGFSLKAHLAVAEQMDLRLNYLF